MVLRVQDGHSTTRGDSQIQSELDSQAKASRNTTKHSQLIMEHKNISNRYILRIMY
jgi:hypothetical protein